VNSGSFGSSEGSGRVRASEEYDQFDDEPLASGRDIPQGVRSVPSKRRQMPQHSNDDYHRDGVSRHLPMDDELNTSNVAHGPLMGDTLSGKSDFIYPTKLGLKTYRKDEGQVLSLFRFLPLYPSFLSMVFPHVFRMLRLSVKNWSNS
jgi:hypothetical protein